MRLASHVCICMYAHVYTGCCSFTRRKRWPHALSRAVLAVCTCLGACVYVWDKTEENDGIYVCAQMDAYMDEMYVCCVCVRARMYVSKYVERFTFFPYNGGKATHIQMHTYIHTYMHAYTERASYPLRTVAGSHRESAPTKC
jgi:hypothetical protein